MLKRWEYENKKAKQLSNREFDDDWNTFNKYFSVNDGANKLPMSIFAKKKYGKHLLIGKTWEGEIDFNNAIDIWRMKKYIM